MDLTTKNVNLNDNKTEEKYGRKEGGIAEENEPEREKWARQIDFLLACVGKSRTRAKYPKSNVILIIFLPF